jgi:hypothetical protein
VVKDDAFIVTVLTPFDTKKNHLLSIVSLDPLPLPFRVEVIPEMTHL